MKFDSIDSIYNLIYEIITLQLMFVLLMKFENMKVKNLHLERNL